MTHGAPDGISHTLPTQGAPRVSLGYVPPPMGQERHRLLELLAGPASHIHRHRECVTSRPDTDWTDQPLLGGVVGSILIAGPLPRSVTVQTNKMRLLSALGTMHLLKNSFWLPTHHALLSVGAHSPVPVLYVDYNTSKGQDVSHCE